MNEVALGELGEFPRGELRAVPVSGTTVLVVHTEEGAILVMEDRCPHALIPLSLGELRGNKLRCTAHGAEFALPSCAPLCGPARTPPAIFPSRVENGILYASLPGSEERT